MNASQIKLCRSLHQKKYRQLEQLFLVEGEKNTVELIISNLEIRRLFVTESFFGKYKQILDALGSVVFVTKEKDILRAGTLKSNNAALAVVQIPKEKTALIPYSPTIMLEDLRDPGNLGTIMRLCDWYGIRNLYCTPSSVDVFNSKVIAASMGAFARVLPTYLEIEQFFALLPDGLMTFAALLEGENLYTTELPNNAIFFIGNESHGLSRLVQNSVRKSLHIPKGKNGGAESLNAATATAIILDNWHRQHYQK